MPESTLAAQPALACELATLSVVCLAWRLRSAIAESRRGPAGDGLQMPVRLGEPHEQVPPVVDESDEARHELAAGQIAGGKASPAPLVLQFIEGIFAIGAIAVELGERQNLLVEGGGEHAIFVDLALRPDLGEAECELTRLVAPGDGQAFLSAGAAR